MNKNGYIKISRSITSHWLWQDAERLRWWLDLLLLASWEDTEIIHDAHRFTLKRGQLIASVAHLKERWEVSHPTVIKFLLLLEAEGMITRKVLYSKIAIITICNYETYQGVETAPVYSTLYSKVYSTLYTNKENKEINNINNNNNAREKEIELISNDATYAEVMMMRHHLTREQYDQQVRDFFLDCDCNGVQCHENAKDLKSHFNNWLKLNKGQHNGKETKHNQRRPTAATLGERKDYEGAF